MIESLDELRELVGQEVAVTDWIEVSQTRINQFAEATGDRQWIHVDLERARIESPYGWTIAHGFLTLSLLSPLISQSIQFASGVRMGINYGLDRVRFPAPVPADSQIRGRFALKSLDQIEGGLQAAWHVTVECQDSVKPACVAEWLVRYYV
jgi:acyl dehydratase